MTRRRNPYADQERRTHYLRLDHILVDDGPRPINPDSVALLAKSMAAIGMQTPIVVEETQGPDGFMSPDPDKRHYRIISGRHRVAAARQLGWEAIETFDDFSWMSLEHAAGGVDVDVDGDLAVRMWAIAENLHRAELTALQRDEQIAEWIALEKKWKEQVKKRVEEVSTQVVSKPQGGGADKPRQLDEVSKGGRGNVGGVAAAARELGISEPDARRAVKVASLSEEAKSVAKETGVDDNRSALLDAAKEADPQKQVASIKARGTSDAAAARRQARDVDLAVKAIVTMATKLQPPGLAAALIRKNGAASAYVDQDIDAAAKWMADFAAAWRESRS